MRTLSSIPILALALAATPALAQDGGVPAYPVLVSSGSYAPLGDAGSPVPGVTGTQNGVGTISLSGWQFPYFGQQFSQITVTTDGYLIVGDGSECGCTAAAGGMAAGCADPMTYCDPSFGAPCSGPGSGCCSLPAYQSSCQGGNFPSCGGGCCTNCLVTPPSNAGPDPAAVGTIAGWWEQLDDSAAKGISYAQGGADGGHFLTVDYHGVPALNTGFSGWNVYDFQITLDESGLVQVTYGQTFAGDAGVDSSSAWASLEGYDGGQWVPGLGCDVDGGSLISGAFSYSGCTAANWPTDTTVSYGSPAGVFLTPSSVQIQGLSLDGGLTIDVTTVASDFGRTAIGSSFDYSVYLVQQPEPATALAACPGGAGCLGGFTASGGVPAQGSATLDTGPITIPIPAQQGSYYVEVWLDPTNSTGSVQPSALVGVSSPLALGIDLTGAVGALPAAVPANGSFQLPITLENLGLLPSGTFHYQLWLTQANTGIDPQTDLLVEDATASLVGGQTVTKTDTATTNNAAQGQYYLALTIDPAHQLGDIDYGNNVVFSATTASVTPAHLKVTAVGAPAEAFPDFPTHVSYTIENDGDDIAAGFAIGLVIHPQSKGTTFTLNDPRLLELDGVTIAPKCTVQAEDGVILQATPAGCATFPSPAVTESKVPATMYGAATAPGNYLVGVIADLYSQVNEARNANRMGAPNVTVVQAPAPDLAVGLGDLTAPPAASAGDRIWVDRSIHNLGIATGSAPYGYFLSDTGEANAGGVPVPVVLPTGVVTYRPTTQTLSPPGLGTSDDRGSDLLALPSGLSPGSYTLSLVIDPDRVAPDLDRTNDTVAAPEPLAISADGLQLLGGNLPPALVHSPYAYQLEISGAATAPAFQLVAGGLPAGLSLSGSGLVSGTPTALGGSTFVVLATSGQKQQLATCALTVAQPSGPLEVVVSGSELPPATVGRAYTLQLAAVGGVPPYDWTADGPIPGGGDLALEPSGLLAGTPATVAAGSLHVTVTDQAGNVVQATLGLRAVDLGTLAITTTLIGPATVGQSFVGPIEATEGDGQNHIYTWTLPQGQELPPGLELVTQGTPALGQLSGTPRLAGSWPFRVVVTDESKHEATREFVLVVNPAPLDVSAQSLPAATQGKPYQVTLQASTSGLVTFSLFSGDLPPGLSVGTDGSIGGTVDAKAEVRTYPFAVLAIDSSGDQALLPLSIQLLAASPAPSGGCGTGGGPGGLLAVGAALWLISRRRRGFVAAVAGAALLLFGALPARAAFGYSVAKGTTTFQDITAQPGTAVLSQSQEMSPTQYPVTLPFPFSYGGSSFSSMTVWSNGAVSFDANGSAQSSDGCGAFPFSNCPGLQTVLAPWWGDLTVCYQASVAWMTTGSPGNRLITVQWTNLNTDDGCQGVSAGQSLFTFQLQLHESSGAVDFIYGPSTQGLSSCLSGSCSFAVGIEDGADGLGGLACNAACQVTDIPGAGTALVFSERPDLQIAQLTAPSAVEQGGAMTLQLEVQNAGAVAASQATGSFFYSPDGGSYDPTAPLGGVGPFNLAGSSSATLRRTVTLPSGAAVGTGYVVAVVQDSGDPDPIGKTLASAPFEVIPATPDLIPTALQIPSGGAPGATVSFAPTIVNQGTATATAVAYAYYLSTDATVSVVDLQVGGGTVASLPPGQTFQTTDQVTLPAGLAPGSYTVGLIVDPAGESPESSRSNETFVAGSRLAVQAGALAVATSKLPPAQVGAPYQALLAATGGDGHYQWSVASGSLPSGLSLDAQLGAIAGTPAAVGTSRLTLKLQDGSGQSATMPLAIQVTALAVPLEVVTTVLPGGSFGVPYQVDLVATGGAPPYLWSLSAGGRPPPGISLSSGGVLAGSPAADGAFVFQVEVQDSTGKSAQSGPLDLEVLSPGRVSVAEAELAPATVGKAYVAELLAVGGTPTYSWQLVSDERLPGGAGDTGQDLAQAMPPGLALETNGAVSGVPTVTGQFALTLQVTDSSTPPDTVTDTVVLTVLPDQALAITNPTLPEATEGTPYRISFDTNATGGQVTFQLVDGLGENSPAARKTLPPGLTIDTTGLLSGTPTATGTFDFLVEASDAENRRAIQAASLTVLPSQGKGCGTAPGSGGGGSLALLLALGALLARRRG